MDVRSWFSCDLLEVQELKWPVEIRRMLTEGISTGELVFIIEAMENTAVRGSIERTRRLAASLEAFANVFAISAIMLVAATNTSIATATDLWVDRNQLGGICDDNRLRSQVTRSTPWCTLEAACNRVLPGDVVRVREGEYSKIHSAHHLSWSSAVLQVVVSGTPEAPIKFMAEPGERVVISGSGGAIYGILITEQSGMIPRFIVIEGFVVREIPDVAVLVSTTTDVVLRHLEVTACPWAAVGTKNSGRITIEGCHVHDNPLGGWTSAITLYGCLDGNIIRGNRIWANTDEDSLESEGHGVILDFCGAHGGALIENNIIWNNEGWCINIFYSDGAVIRNNTCWRNSQGRFDGTGEVSIRGLRTEIFNNILVSRNGVPALQIYDSPGDMTSVVSDFNIFWSLSDKSIIKAPPSPWVLVPLFQHQETNAYQWDQSSIQVDPLLVDPATANFRPSSNSAAIDTANNDKSPTFDVEGRIRPIDGDRDGSAIADRGAYEYFPLIRNSNNPPLRRIRPEAQKQ